MVKRVTFGLGVFLGVVALTETGLRFFDPAGLSYFAETTKYFAAMQPHTEYAYSHVPDSRERFQGVDVTINRHGFRGHDVKFENPERRPRVLVLGDSVVFGWGAPQESIFPVVLQSLLADEFPGVEVIPAGVGSWNTRTEYEYLRAEGFRFESDAIVLVVTSNDLEPKRTGRTEVPRARLIPGGAADAGGDHALFRTMWQSAVSWSYAFAYVQFVRRKRDVARQESAFTGESPQWEDARLALDGIVRLARERGAELLIVLSESASRIDGTPLRLYRDYVSQVGIRCVLLPETLFSDPSLRNSAVDAHPNARGHALIAEVLHHQLAPIVRSVTAGRRVVK